MSVLYRSYKNHLSNKGSVLILTLWTLVILSLLTISLAGGVKQRVIFHSSLYDNERLRNIAESGAKKAIAYISSIDSSNPFYYNELSNVDEEGFNNISFEDGYFTVKSRKRESAVSYFLEDENGRININTADAALLKILLSKAAGLDRDEALELAYAVIDYRDADDNMKGKLKTGSEEDYYMMNNMPYGPKNSDFEFISELKRVKGMNDHIFYSINEYITVYGNGVVNINTADVNVLAIILEDSELARKIANMRNGEDGILGTGDDFVFNDSSFIIRQVTDLVSLTDSEKQSLIRAIMYNKMSVYSDHFRIISRAGIKSSAKEAVVACVYGFKKGVRYWVEYT